ncbi:MAG: capsular biosynthesis protein, partial [Clostridiales bacterium]|nr:capsular biosynthesis protein [Clostridiales bacterium]
YVAKEIADEIAEVGANFISIKMDQDPPTIIQNGYADGDPVSPNTIKNTVIGGILGAVLAIAIVVLSYLFNDTIMTAEDIEKKLSLNILGTLPLEEAEDDGDKRAQKKKKKREKKRAKKAKKHRNRAKPGRSRRESGL